MVTISHDSRQIQISIPAGNGNVGRILRTGRFYEQKMLTYIQSLNKNGTYVDVGANIGNHTIFFAMFTDATQVVSYEPFQTAFEFLKRNIDNNELSDKVVAKNVAIGEKSGRCSLQQNDSDQIGGTKVVSGNDVELCTLDQQNLSNVVLIKVDVEGFEESVLQGARELISRDQPELFIEITDRDHVERITTFLHELGYRLVTIYNNSATFHFSASCKPSFIDYLARPYVIRRVLRNS